jgi:hypothetical protein
LDERGASWQWYDESGDGWQPTSVRWGTLGDPEIGALGSSKVRTDRDEKRAFGNLVTAMIEQSTP